MTGSLLESEVEYSFRVLLLLNTFMDRYFSEEYICIIDFMAIYANDFVPKVENIHGYGLYRFGEYFEKKRAITSVMKRLVRCGYVQIVNDTQYTISDKGKELCDKMVSEYARNYIDLVRYVYVVNKLSGGDIASIEKEIKNKMYVLLGDCVNE